MTTIVTIDMGGTGATHAAGAREALSVPSITDMGQSYAQANAAYGQANTARSDANTTFGTVNTTFGTVNTSLGTINTNYQAAYAQANTARSDANSTFATINTTFSTLNTSFSSTNTNYQAAYAQANTARDTANNAYNNSNTKLSTSGGSISGDLSITGNLTVQGNATTINVSNLAVNDSIILLATGGTGDSTDIGFIGHFQRGATDTHAGLIRKATHNQFYLFDNYEVEPTNNVIDVAGQNFRVGNLRLGIINANSYVTAAGLDVTGQANAAYTQANAARSDANTTFATVNTTFGTINTNYQAAYAQANTARSDANTTFATVNTTFATVNTTFATINTTFETINTTTATMNTATSNRVLKAGDTMTGQLNISSGGLLVTGNVNIDANTLFVDSVNDRVGIGTTAPSTKLEVGGSNYPVLKIKGSQQPSLYLASGGGDTEIYNAYGTYGMLYTGFSPSNSSQLFYFDGYGKTYANSKLELLDSKLVITGGGYVGIGTASPGRKFHVSTTNADIAAFNGANTGLVIQDNGSGLNQVELVGYRQDDTSYNDILMRGSTVGLFINGTTGNVGIGTATATALLTVGGDQGGTVGSAVANFSKTMVVGANNYNVGYCSGNAVMLMVNSYSNDGTDNVYPIYVEDENNLVDFYLNAGNNGSTSTKTAYFGGNVGVGATPAFTSGSGIEIQRATATATLRLDSSSFATELYGYTDGTGLYQLSAGYLDLGTDNTTRLRIHANGNVCIGTTATYFNERLTVNGITRVVDLHVAGGVGNSNYARFSHDDANLTISMVRVSGAGHILLSPFGNVGIGTTNPGYKLHFYNSSASDVIFESGTSGTSGKIILKTSDNADTAKYLGMVSYWTVLGVNSNEGFRVNEGSNTLFQVTGSTNGSYPGRVGVGTTTPSAKLHVQQAAPTGVGAVPSGTTAVFENAGNNYITMRHSADGGFYSGMVFEDNNIGGYVIHGDGGSSDKLFIAGYGGVDIQYGSSNSVTPGARTTVGSFTSTGLTVTGNMSVSGYFTNIRGNGSVSAPSTSDHSLGTRITLYDSSATAWYAIGIESDTMWFNSDNQYKWYVDAAQKMILDSSGNLTPSGKHYGSITSSGTGDSNAPFIFNADYSAWASHWAGTPGSNNGWGLFWAGNSGAQYGTNGAGGPGDIWSNSGNPNEAVFVGNGSTVWTSHLNTGNVWQKGHFYCAGDVYTSYSDKRLKDIIGPITNAVEKIKKIDTIYYTANELAKSLGVQEKGTQVGVTSQSVKEVLPEVVVQSPVNVDYDTVQYERLVPLLIAAIKEQQEQIEELKKKLGA